MIPFAKLTSLIALIAVSLPCLLYFAGVLSFDAVNVAALIGTIVWFVATPLWMDRDLPIDSKEVEI